MTGPQEAQPHAAAPAAREVTGAAPTGAAPARSTPDQRLTVRPVSGKRELRLFRRLPWGIYRDDPLWVPPLMMDVKAVIGGDHPFHLHADVEYFLAWRGERPVGRVAAIVNHRHVEFTGENVGFFGLFEAEDDSAAAAALLSAAEGWLRERGMRAARGPMNLSTNEELHSPGILVEGFDTPPMIMMAHARPYYAALVEAAGYAKAKDLLAYYLKDGTPPERLVRGVARLQHQEGITLRPIDMKHFDADVDRIKAIYNSAWEQNWGFVPMTEPEFAHMAKVLKPIVEPRLVLIAEIEREAVAFAMALPDFNQVLKRLNGRLFPTGFLKLLWHRRRINAARVITLGIKPGYRKKGLDAMMYLRLFQDGPPIGFPRAECSWILEDNWEMRRGLERMGAFIYKVYRVYERAI